MYVFLGKDWRLGFLLLLALAAGCGGNSGGTGSLGPGVWTPAKQASIDLGRSFVNNAIAAEPSFETVSGRRRVAEVIKTSPDIDFANVTSDGSLSVKFKAGGIQVFLHDTPSFAPPDRLSQPTIKSNKRGTFPDTFLPSANVAIINSIADDTEGFGRESQRIRDAAVELKNANQHVTLIEGKSASPTAFADLSSNSLIVFMGHGGYFSVDGATQEEYSLATGTEWNDKDQYATWVAKGTVCGSVEWGPTATRKYNHKSFVCLTAKYWTTNYSSTSFHHALFINGSCNGDRDPLFIATLKQLGIESYLGWSNETYRGADADAALVSYLVSGYDIRSAFDALPHEYKEVTGTDNGDSYDSFLNWHGEGTTKLFNPLDAPAFLHIDSPINGATTATPVISIAGHVDSWDSNAWNLSLELNGTISKLPVSPDGIFAISVAVQTGDNAVRLRLDTPYGVEDHLLHVTANIPTQKFWSEMRWNTNSNDIDLHFLPSNAQPFSIDDCYYANKETSWGANLDVDVTTGYGPEHITVPNDVVAGKYLLMVHYFATHGVTLPVTPSVSFVVNGTTHYYTCPTPMTSEGDIWNVAYISFPGGEVTPANGSQSLIHTKIKHPLKLAKLPLETIRND